MEKIKRVKVKEKHSLEVEFASGTQGIYPFTAKFTGIARPLKDSSVFASAKVIHDGYAVGFEGCDFDICAQEIFVNLRSKRVKSRKRLFRKKAAKKSKATRSV